MIKVFISGPYTPQDQLDLTIKPESYYRKQVINNIDKAEEVAIELTKQGFAVFTPHLNFAEFEEQTDSEAEEIKLYSDILLACKEFISVCDCILMLPNWQDSNGSMDEYNYALGIGKKVFFSIADLINNYKE